MAAPRDADTLSYSVIFVLGAAYMGVPTGRSIHRSASTQSKCSSNMGAQLEGESPPGCLAARP